MDATTLPIGIDVARMRAGDARDSVAKSAGADETAKKFESVFSTLLVKEMRRSLSDGFFGEGAQGDIYSGWLDQNVGESLANRDALHMREMIQRSVLSKTEAPR